MLTQQEKEQMENVFKRNKKLGIAPQTKSQLAKKLGMSRQLLYYVIAKNVNSPYEPILKNWIKEANGKGCKIVYKVKENKLKLLEKYGFEHSFKSYYTKYTTMETGSYQYVVNESDLILKLIVTNEDKVMLDLEKFELPYERDTYVADMKDVEDTCIFDEKITNFDIIYNLVRDNIIYRVLIENN